jgi:hypothetical protein
MQLGMSFHRPRPRRPTRRQSIILLASLWVISLLGLWATFGAPLNTVKIIALCILIGAAVGIAVGLLDQERDR